MNAQEFGSFGSYSVTLRLSNPRLSIVGKTQPAPFPNRVDDDFVHIVRLSATTFEGFDAPTPIATFGGERRWRRAGNLVLLGRFAIANETSCFLWPFDWLDRS
jgi:hypothetical protein